MFREKRVLFLLASSLLLAAQPPPEYGKWIARYRSGAFVEALRAAMALPMDELEEAARAFRSSAQQASPSDLLAPAMLHLDLAAAAGKAPEDNEKIAWETLRKADPTGAWATEARFGLVGVYWDMGRWGDVTRILEELRDADRHAPEWRLLTARFSEMIGFTIHDERFFGYAWSLYLGLLEEDSPVLEPGPETGVRIRLAHLALRNGDPEEALARLDDIGTDANALQRFAAQLIRGETLLWLGRYEAAEEALTRAQAFHVGSFTAATALATARRLRGDLAGAEEAMRLQREAADGEDAWWEFLSGGLEEVSGRLDRLRGLVLDR